MTEAGCARRVVDLSQDSQVARRKVHNIPRYRYSVGIQNQTLNMGAPPFRAQPSQVALFGLSRETGIGLSTAQGNNLKHRRNEQLVPTLPSLRCV